MHDLPPFPFRRADHTRYGITRHEIDTDRFLRPYPGVRLLRPTSPEPPTPYSETMQAAHHFAPLLRPRDLYSHTTALKLFGCPVHDDRTLHVASPAEGAPFHLQGVSGHRYRGELPQTHIQGLPLVSPFTALTQSATMLPERELIIAIDHLMLPHYRTGAAILPLSELVTASQQSSTHGVRSLRQALQLSELGAESRYETILRLELMSRGITDLALQVELHDAQGFIGRFDLLSRSRSAIFEFDGEQHRTDRRQYQKDLDRLDRARLAGWRVLRFHYEEVAVNTEAIDAKLARFGL